MCGLLVGSADAACCESWVVGLAEGRPCGVAISRRGLRGFWRRWAKRCGGGCQTPSSGSRAAAPRGVTCRPNPAPGTPCSAWDPRDAMLEALADGGGDADLLQMIDSTSIRAHRCAAGGRGPIAKSWALARWLHEQAPAPRRHVWPAHRPARDRRAGGRPPERRRADGGARQRSDPAGPARPRRRARDPDPAEPPRPARRQPNPLRAARPHRALHQPP